MIDLKCSCYRRTGLGRQRAQPTGTNALQRGFCAVEPDVYDIRNQFYTAGNVYIPSTTNITNDRYVTMVYIGINACVVTRTEHIIVAVLWIFIGASLVSAKTDVSTLCLELTTVETNIDTLRPRVAVTELHVLPWCSVKLLFSNNNFLTHLVIG